jgi:hypothetical protein
MTTDKVAEHGHEETSLQKVVSAQATAPAVDQPYDIDESTHNYPGPAKLVVIMLSIYISVFLIALDRTIIGVAIPEVSINCFKCVVCDR